MPRVLMNFDHRDYWSVHFIEADCRTLIGPQTRYFRFATVDGLRAFAIRCNIEDLANFEYSLRAWGRGSNYVNLTDEQYNKLRSCYAISHLPRFLTPRQSESRPASAMSTAASVRIETEIPMKPQTAPYSWNPPKLADWTGEAEPYSVLT